MKKRKSIISIFVIVAIILILSIVLIIYSKKNNRVDIEEIKPIDVSNYDENDQVVLLDAMEDYCKINNEAQNKNDIVNILSLTDLQYLKHDEAIINPLLDKIKLLSELKNMDLAVSSGDLNCSEENKEVSLNTLKYITSRFKEITIPTLYALGNHDRFIYGLPEYDISKEEYYNITFSDFDSSYKFNEKDPYAPYYYKDIEDKKLRVCVLNSFSAGNYEFVINYEQLKFITSDMLNFEEKENPSDWTIVFFIHTILPTEVHQEYVQGSDTLFRILKAYKNGETINLDRNTEFDFSSMDRANIAAIFTGHHHLDYSIEYDDILVIGLSAIRSIYDRSDIKLYANWSRYYSDTRFEIISIDTKNKTIYTTRVGNGENRFWNY